VTSICPSCGGAGFDGLDSDFSYCEVCDEFFAASDSVDESGYVDDLGNLWCDVCADLRPVDDDLHCLRCGSRVS